MAVLIVLAFALVAPRAGNAVEAHAPVTDTIVFEGAGGTPLHGTWVVPSSEPGEFGWPAMTLVHGSGRGERERLLPLAEAFAAHGIITLVYDKRTEGYSRFERDYSLLAKDAVAAVQVLRARDDIDPQRVGVWGFSEGGWVAPMAASMSDAIDFLVLVAANGGLPAEQQQWGSATTLDSHGVRGSLVRAYSQTWLRQAIGMGMFAAPYHDPLPALREIEVPVLALWGEYDRQTPPAESLKTVRETLDSADHPSYTLRIIPEADHALHQTPDEGFTRGDAFASGYVDMVASWIDDLAGGAPASSADAAPAQERTTQPVAPLAWYESPWLTLGGFVVFVVAFVGYAAVALARRIRGQRSGAAVTSARWLTVSGLLASLGMFIYLGLLQVTTAQVVGPVVAGRPIPWLALQLLALVTVAGLIATVVGWWTTRTDVATGERVRLGLVVVAGLVFVPWGLYWGLLLP